MKKYAILRVSKISNYNKLAQANGHNTRTIKVKNADPKKNAIRVYGDNDIVEQHKELLSSYNITPRSNAVLALEYIATYSPEMKDEISIKDWYRANQKFFQKKHGIGLLSIDLHLDESTPHLHIIVAPMIKKVVRGVEQQRLSAKDFIDGKKMLSKLQDDYAEDMSAFGLERGVKGSKMTHKKIKTYYSELEKELDKAERVALEMASSPNPSIFNYKKDVEVMKKNLKAIAKRMAVADERVRALRAKNSELSYKLSISHAADLEKKQRDLEAKINHLEAALNETHKELQDKNGQLKDKDELIELQKERIRRQSRELQKTSHYDSKK